MRNLVMTALVVSFSWTDAASLQDAQVLLDLGDVLGAVSTALEQGTSDGFALAAKATTLGATLLPVEQQEAALGKAVEYAEKAVSLNPNNAKAYFELARAEGRLAQSKSIWQAMGLVGDVRNALNKAVTLNPRFASAYAALGLWNAEAPMIAGGNKGQVQPNFERAIQLEPHVIAHRLEYANALMKVNLRNKPSAISVLERAVRLPPRNFWDQRDLEAAKRLLAELKAGS